VKTLQVPNVHATKMKKRKTEKWDEHLVIAVLVVSTICILIMLTSFMSVTGKATMTGVVSTSQVLEMLNQNVVTVEGEGTMKCNYACGKMVKYTLVSYIDGQFVENNEIRSGKYICSCISN